MQPLRVNAAIKNQQEKSVACHNVSKTTALNVLPAGKWQQQIKARGKKKYFGKNLSLPQTYFFLLEMFEVPLLLFSQVCSQEKQRMMELRKDSIPSL